MVAHHFFSIHDEIVWDIIERKIPELTGQIESSLKEI